MAAYKLTWTAAPTGGSASISGYEVIYTPLGGSPTVVQTGSTATTYILTGLTDGVVYSFGVRVAGGAITPPTSASVYSADPPSQVTGLSVDATGDGTLDLSWSAPASDASITDYSVEYTPAGGSASTVLVGSSATSYQLTSLTNGTEYSVRVAAASVVGTGSYSSAVTGTPAAPAVSEILYNFDNQLTDQTGNGYTLSADPSATFDSTNKKFGTHSRAYPPYSYDTGNFPAALLSGDFTVECFVRLNTGVIGNTVYAGSAWSMNDSSFATGDNLVIYWDGYSSPPGVISAAWYDGATTSFSAISTTPVIDDGAFRHLAFVREGTTFRVYYDGVRIIESTGAGYNNPLTAATCLWSIGADSYMYGYDGLDGNLDDWRLSLSALYSGATITVPSSPLT